MFGAIPRRGATALAVSTLLIGAVVVLTPTATATAASASTEQRLIVGYKSSSAKASSDQAAAENVRGKGRGAAMSRRLGTGAVLVDVADGTANRLMAEFRADPDVAYVELDQVAYPTMEPDDTEYNRQWHYSEAAAGMRLPDGWDTATGQGIRVAVLDTGYVAHNDLAANVVAGYDFVSNVNSAGDGDGRDNDSADPGDFAAAGLCGRDVNGNPVPAQDKNSSWHGTHVAGTVAAATNNNTGVAGVAFNARVQPVRVLGKCGGSTADIADAITWASGGQVNGVPDNANRAHVINMSLGGRGVCSQTYRDAINAAVGRGTTIVVAAGNNNIDAVDFNPANCANVITVAAANRAGGRAFYSNFGATVDITAPGGQVRNANDPLGAVTTPADGILSTGNTGLNGPGNQAYTPMMGTSMAAPHIAGLAALMLSVRGDLTPAQIEQHIGNTARAMPVACPDDCGAGLADATAAVRAVIGQTFTNGTDVAIPDNGGQVFSAIDVAGVNGNAPAALRVSVDIKHTYRGDLVIDLIAPDGTAYRLKNSSGDSAANVITTYTVNASTEPANGNWRLRVQDVADVDTGTIDTWSLTF